jgi:hypothetical protein
MSEKRFNRGDRVAWDTPQGKTTGRVVENLTNVVESDKTGKRAAHRSEALERRGS